MIISDLEMNKELDRKALSAVRGGYSTYPGDFCGTPPGNSVPEIYPPWFAMPVVPVTVPGEEVVSNPLKPIAYPDL